MRFVPATLRGKAFAGLAGAVAIGVVTNLVTDLISSGPSVVGSIVSRDAPVHVQASFSGNGSWLVPKAVSQLELPEGNLRDEATWHNWAISHGGSEDSTLLRIVVQGRTERAVVLTGLEVEVVQRQSPPEGSRVMLSAGAGLPERLFSVDLDDPLPRLEYTHGEEPSKEVNFPYRVSSAEPEVFMLEAHTAKCDCRWNATLAWVADGEEGSTTIDEEGEPFRTISSRGAAAYYVGDGRFDPLMR